MVDLLREGLVLARAKGCLNPQPADAVWELLIEAADTLRRLPDPERPWLDCNRSAWPEVVRERAERWAAAVADGGWGEAKTQPGPPDRAAITRMDALFQALTALPRPLDARRAFLLAGGVPARVISERTKCSRRTVFYARDRVVQLLGDRLKYSQTNKLPSEEKRSCTLNPVFGNIRS